MTRVGLALVMAVTSSACWATRISPSALTRYQARFLLAQ